MSESSSLALTDLLDSPRGLTWVMAGDSITQGVGATRLARSYVEHLHEAVRGELRRFEDTIINTGVSGFRADQVLADFDGRIGRWRPDVVTIMLGTNDASTAPHRPRVEVEHFATDLRELVSRTQSLGAFVVLQTPPGADVANLPVLDRIGQFAQAVREVATGLKVPLVDQYAAWVARAEARQTACIHGLLNDACHPNECGHALLALTLFEALGLDARAPRTTAMLRQAAERW